MARAMSRLRGGWLIGTRGHFGIIGNDRRQARNICKARCRLLEKTADPFLNAANMDQSKHGFTL